LTIYQNKKTISTLGNTFLEAQNNSNISMCYRRNVDFSEPKLIFKGGLMKKTFLIVIFLAAFSTPAGAQNSIEEFYCSDYHSSRVQIISDASARQMVEAGISTLGAPQIRVNPAQLKDLSKNTRAFAINHVCANHTLGHLVRGVEDIYDHYDRVGNADCWAAAKLFYAGIVDKDGVDAIEEEINQLTREQWSHFPGPVRVVSLNDVCELKEMK